MVPAGYTYFGQFIDHDLTFDSTSTLDKLNNKPTNMRTPRFDLDCVYGDGPDAQPFMYEEDGATLIYNNNQAKWVVKNPYGDGVELAEVDLFRNPNGRAIIGDKRNDENSIVCQIQLAFIKYHNAVVIALKKSNSKLSGSALFNTARNEVRWTYQKLVLEDFLPRIVNAQVLKGLNDVDKNERAKNYALYTEDKRGNLPREFVAAAYRFGHSQIRAGYRMNAQPDNRFHIFGSSIPNKKNTATVANEAKESPPSLVGFEPLPKSHVIDDWGRFFPETTHEKRAKNLGTKADGDNADGKPIRLQYAYKIDTSLVDPLSVLPRASVAGEETAKQAEVVTGNLKDPNNRPSLALLNLLRANEYRIQSGQAVAKALQDKGYTACKTMTLDQLAIRKKDEHTSDNGDTFFKFNRLSDLGLSSFMDDTPLWFYVLAEAQAPLLASIEKKVGHNKQFNEDEMLKPSGSETQLGWVGGRIVAEVFYGLVDSDAESYVNMNPIALKNWKPMLGKNKPIIFKSLLEFDGNN